MQGHSILGTAVRRTEDPELLTGGARYTPDLDATGVLENVAVITPANGRPTTVSTRGPVIGPDSIPKDPAPASRRPLARTGAMVPTGMAAGLGLGAIALFALRRRMTTA